MFFNFGDGMPGGGSMGGGHARGPVNNKKFYEVLGVERSASEAEIKKAYRKKAIQHHPDKSGGDPTMFQEIAHAYEILSDPQKKQIYDQHGEEGLDGAAGGGGGHGDAMDIFDMMFGGGGRGGGRQQQKRVRKTKDTTFGMDASLEQLYTGATRKIAVNRDVLCGTCDGNGGPASKFQTCQTCDGNGVVTRMQRMGPVIHQSQAACDKCAGKGRTIDPKFLCSPCKGQGIKAEKKTLEVYIPKGCNDEEKIVYEGMSDEAKDCVAGDVIVVIKEAPHALFKRAGTALIIEREVGLLDMLVGFVFDLKHLDGQKVIVRKAPGFGPNNSSSEVVKCESAQKIFAASQILTVPNMGMPMKDSSRRGPLHVVLKIKWPAQTEICDEKCELLRQALGKSLLPTPKFSLDTGDCDIADLGQFQQAVESRGRGQHGHDESDERGGGQEGVQCRQQ